MSDTEYARHHETVCRECGKVAVMTGRPWGTARDRMSKGPPLDGMVREWKCPDGCGAGLVRREFLLVPASPDNPETGDATDPTASA